MSKTPNIFVRSLRELKSTRCLALTALLLAANLALDLMGLELRLPPDLKIGFGFLTNASVGMLFGPAVAMMAGVCTDLLGYFIGGGFTMGGYFPGYTLTAIVAGLFWGLWLYPRRVSVWRAIGAKTCINVFCNIGLNTLWLTQVVFVKISDFPYANARFFGILYTIGEERLYPFAERE